MTLTLCWYKKINQVVVSVAMHVNARNSMLIIALLGYCTAVNAVNNAGEKTPLVIPSTVEKTTSSDHEYKHDHRYAFPVAEPEKLAKKLYRQALFYYFQDQPELALQQLTYNKARLPLVDDNALLFEAGLQVSLGLYHQAEKNLTFITTKLSHSSAQQDSTQTSPANADQRFDYFASQDLLAVALLQLAEQQINQQQPVSAQQTLAKLSHLPDGYYQQYHILSQLAFWPQVPKLTLTMPAPLENSELKNQQNDAYILLNEALICLEQKALVSAEQKLSQLKRMNWQAPKKTFWQQLFASDKVSNLENKKSSELEQQSLQDYASLLLAQLYVEQEQFSLAYRELANFPQHSPFTEQALFLFAYASMKTQHYAESEAIFSLLSTGYPTSYLAWQADVLLARQYLIQRDLDTALAQYLALESKYQQQLASLANFEQQISVKPIAVDGNFISNNEQALQASVWWDKAIASARLNGQFQQANELTELNEKITQQQQQVQWLDYTLELNQRRQTKIIAQQQTQNYQASITELQRRRDKLAQQLDEAKIQGDASVFASGPQQQWLQRISKSKNVIVAMNESPAYRKKALKYQSRLKRVEAVLAWQMQQQFPQRLWQHQTQLQQLDELLAKLQQQMTQVTAIQQLAEQKSPDDLTNSSNSVVEHAGSANATSKRGKNQISKIGIDLPKLQQRQQRVALQSLQLKQAITSLGNLTNQQIQADLLAFIAEQRQSLNYYLHHSRRAMAKILEALKKVDLASSENSAIMDKAIIGAASLGKDLQRHSAEHVQLNPSNIGDGE